MVILEEILGFSMEKVKLKNGIPENEESNSSIISWLTHRLFLRFFNFLWRIFYGIFTPLNSINHILWRWKWNIMNRRAHIRFNSNARLLKVNNPKRRGIIEWIVHIIEKTCTWTVFGIPGILLAVILAILIKLNMSQSDDSW